MAEQAEKDFLAAQAASIQSYVADSGAFDAGADNTDSDDYDPSATMQEDYSVLINVSEQHTTAAEAVAPLAEAASAYHALLSNTSSRSASATTAQDTSGSKHFPSSSLPMQSKPRIKGGFVIDDEDEDDEDSDTDDDTKDVLDVYGTAEATDAAASVAATVPQPVTSISTPYVPIQGAPPAPKQSNNVPNGVSDVAPSPTVPGSDIVFQPASTPVPVQSAQAYKAQIVSTSSSMTATPVSAPPKARLAHDTVGILEDRIKEDPRGDLAAWLELISELKSRNKPDEVRRVYTRFFEVFPLAAEQWAAYADWEQENDQLNRLEHIFSRSLLSVPSVQLWSIYVNYIRRRNSMTTGDTARSYKIISDCFNFAINNVGKDKDSGKLWQDYVEFIKSGPGMIGGTGWQDTQKMDALRAAYQKAICVPTSALFQLWREYDLFENGLSKINGRRFLQERSPAYMTARSGYTQLQNMTRDLDRTTLPKLPPALGFDGDVEYLKQVEIWKEWVRWEKDDNLVLKDEDPHAFRDRVVFVYKHALMALQFWPEMWYDAADFCFSNNMEKEGLDFLVQGIAASPESCLLALKLADRIESTTVSDEGADPGAKQRMRRVREPYDKVLDALYELIIKARAREAQDIARIEATLSNGKATFPMSGRPEEEDDERTPEDAERETAAIHAQIDSVKRGADVQVGLLQKTISYVWVALMRAARRTQGKGMQGERGGGFRAIFGDARKKGKITSHVYVESALIEYHCYKDPAGTKIFERGMKLFPTDEMFALEYLKHLIAINDITNARAVFETTVGKLTSDSTTVVKAKPIFLFLHEYESHFGELSQVARLEKRMRELYPEDLELRHFAQRYVSSGFDPTTVRPIVSPQQVKTKTLIHRSVEGDTSAVDSPPMKLSETAATNSPKRPLPTEDFEDTQPRKVARGESPLKGAAGRRMDQQKRQNLNGHAPSSLSQVHLPPPPPLPGHIAFLLSIIPKASTYVDARFDPIKMVELLRDVRLPPTAFRAPEATPSWHQHQQPPPPHFHPQAQSVMHSGMMPSGHGMGQPQYGAPFRYA